jgi:ABC-type dipeptide/oligopeptide/nickel transport system ATPase component
MQLKRLALKEYRNLHGIDITFAEKFENPRNTKPDVEKLISSHALIGQNGTGKSNLMEAIITIFRDVDLDRDAAFDYVLEYSIRGYNVKIEADTEKQKRPYVWVDCKSESQGYLLRNTELLPSHIFAYYSGRNERMEALFQEHQRRFNRRQEITAEEVLSPEVLRNLSNSDADRDAMEKLRKREENKQLKNFGDDRLRRLFYCRGGHSQLVLLACLLSDDPVFKKVLENLNIESLESAIFVLKQPHRLRRFNVINLSLIYAFTIS